MASITIEEATRIKESIDTDLMKKPGVTGIDVGLRSARAGGDEPVIRVYVESKASAPADVKSMTSVQGVAVELVERRFSLH
jgi:phosphomannomutase